MSSGPASGYGIVERRLTLPSNIVPGTFATFEQVIGIYWRNWDNAGFDVFDDFVGDDDSNLAITENTVTRFARTHEKATAQICGHYEEAGYTDMVGFDCGVWHQGFCGELQVIFPMTLCLIVVYLYMLLRDRGNKILLVVVSLLVSMLLTILAMQMAYMNHAYIVGEKGEHLKDLECGFRTRASEKGQDFISASFSSGKLDINYFVTESATVMVVVFMVAAFSSMCVTIGTCMLHDTTDGAPSLKRSWLHLPNFRAATTMYISIFVSFAMAVLLLASGPAIKYGIFERVSDLPGTLPSNKSTTTWDHQIIGIFYTNWKPLWTGWGANNETLFTTVDSTTITTETAQKRAAEVNKQVPLDCKLYTEASYELLVGKDCAEFQGQVCYTLQILTPFYLVGILAMAGVLYFKVGTKRQAYVLAIVTFLCIFVVAVQTAILSSEYIVAKDGSPLAGTSCGYKTRDTVLNATLGIQGMNFVEPGLSQFIFWLGAMSSLGTIYFLWHLTDEYFEKSPSTYEKDGETMVSLLERGADSIGF